ncbi:MAG: long-chain fatty acid--CoA ligase [Elusimicrobia bacterium]|nr:long-chain fatty acid--CoA ligase [Elusimicrobiota bacterium]
MERTTDDLSIAETILRCETDLGEVVPNIGTMLRERRDLFGKRPAYREKIHGPYRTLSWEKLYNQTAAAGASLIGLGVRKGDVIASYSRNRREMLLAELASMSLGAVFCPIFSEYPAKQLDYLLEHSGARFLAVSDESHLKEVLETKASRKLERIFMMEPSPRSGKGRTAPFETLCRADAAAVADFEKRAEKIHPEQPCLLMYTSGTTGRPKGVLLCHRNILSQRKAMGLLWNLGPEDRFLSYLPWHHSFGGIFELFAALYCGALLTLDESYGKDIPLLIENFKKTRPTIYFSVPSIYQALVAEARRSESLEREIFHPELKFIFTAAAPLPSHLSDYFKTKGIPVVEGWGLTETSPCVTVTPPRRERKTGAVGVPIPGDEVKLTPLGEILVRGPNVMLGYHKDPDLTSRVLEPDGWFHTGDFGEISPDGLVLKCRMDGMFKLTTGQMVISQDVENALIASPLVKHAIVFGSGESFVGAVLFPAFPVLRQAARDLGIAPSTDSLLLKQPRIRQMLRSQVQKAAQSVPEKYARPKAFILAEEEPSLKNGELTPTLKVVKPRVLKNYAPLIRAIFDPRGAAPHIRKEVIQL